PRRPRPRTVRPPAPGAGPAQFPDDSYAYLLAHPVQGGRADPGDLQQILHRLERAVLATPLDEVLCPCGADPGQRLQFLGRGRIHVHHGLLVLRFCPGSAGGGRATRFVGSRHIDLLPVADRSGQVHPAQIGLTHGPTRSLDRGSHTCAVSQPIQTRIGHLTGDMHVQLIRCGLRGATGGARIARGTRSLRRSTRQRQSGPLGRGGPAAAPGSGEQTAHTHQHDQCHQRQPHACHHGRPHPPSAPVARRRFAPVRGPLPSATWTIGGQPHPVQPVLGSHGLEAMQPRVRTSGANQGAVDTRAAPADQWWGVRRKRMASGQRNTSALLARTTPMMIITKCAIPTPKMATRIRAMDSPGTPSSPGPSTLANTGPTTIADPTSTTTARITVRPQFAANLAFSAATGPLRRCDRYTAAMTIPAIRKDTYGIGMKQRNPIAQETVPLAGGWEYAAYPYCGAAG